MKKSRLGSRAQRPAEAPTNDVTKCIQFPVFFLAQMFSTSQKTADSLYFLVDLCPKFIYNTQMSYLHRQFAFLAKKRIKNDELNMN